MNRRTLLLAMLSVAATAAKPAPLFAQVKAAEPTAADMLAALKARPMRSAVSLPAIDPATHSLLADLKQRAQRGLSVAQDHLNSVEPVVAASAFVDIEILFAFNSAAIMKESDPLLASLALALTAPELAQSDFFIAGHTDAKGRRPVNKSMSERRARAVRDALVTRHGLSPDRLIPVGYGSDKLKVPGDPFAAANRRVQIVNLLR